jgi:hypothetical protein
MLSYIGADKRSSAVGEAASALRHIITLLLSETKKERFRDLAFLLTVPIAAVHTTAGKNTLSKLTYKVVYQA